MEGNVRREDRGRYVDALAAVFILQGYLDNHYISQETDSEE
jgi:RNase H-fold protein (predicted Holliday junction resolvase)